MAWLLSFVLVELCASEEWSVVGRKSHVGITLLKLAQTLKTRALHRKVHVAHESQSCKVAMTYVT